MKTLDIKRKVMPLINEDEPPSKLSRIWIVRKILNPASNYICNLYFRTKLNWALPIIALVAMAWMIGFAWMEGSFWPSRLIISAHSIGIRTAHAAEIEETVWPDIGDCEQYRPVVEKYFGKLTDEALFVASKESGCIADRISPPNSDGSRDFCLLQINREPLTAQSLDACVRRAWEKYQAGRVGENNWSAWYAVCLKENTKANPLPYPVAKYPNVIKNCS